jgi:O-antigen/teichoic acid export membrane protein
MVSEAHALDDGRRIERRLTFHAIAGQTAAGLIWTGVALAAAFLLKVVLARRMPPEQMGTVLAVQSFTVLALAVAELGIPDAVVRFVGRDTDGRTAPRRTVYQALKVVVPATLAVTVLALAGLGIWFGASMPADARLTAAIFMLAMPILAAGNVLGAAFRGVNRLATKLLLTDVARPAVVTLALLVSPLALTQHASYVAALYAGGALVTLGVVWLVFARDDRWRDGGGTRADELVRFGLPLTGAAIIAGPLVNSVIPLMLSAWPGPAAVALFSITLSLQGIVYLPVAVVEQAALPTWSRMAVHRGTDDIGASYKQFATMGFAAAASLGLVLLANDRAVLASVFGATYAEASGALRWVVLATLFGAFTGPNEGMLRAFGLTGAIFRARTVAASVGVAAGAALIPAYGLAGAIAAFVIVALIINGLYAVTLYRTRGIHPWSKSHATASVIVLAGLAAIAWLSDIHVVGGWIIAHVSALLVLMLNADVRSAAARFVMPVPTGR